MPLRETYPPPASPFPRTADLLRLTGFGKLRLGVFLFLFGRAIADRRAQQLAANLRFDGIGNVRIFTQILTRIFLPLADPIAAVAVPRAGFFD